MIQMEGMKNFRLLCVCLHDLILINEKDIKSILIYHKGIDLLKSCITVHNVIITFLVLFNSESRKNDWFKDDYWFSVMPEAVRSSRFAESLRLVKAVTAGAILKNFRKEWFSEVIRHFNSLRWENTWFNLKRDEHGLHIMTNRRYIFLSFLGCIKKVDC